MTPFRCSLFLLSAARRSPLTKRDRSLIDSALAYWTADPESNKRQIARTVFLKAKVIELAGNPQKAAAALKMASRVRLEATSERKAASELVFEDFDSLVMHWYQ